ncbi:hypothetical protein RSJ2_3702 (plasmid) [Clostridium botulinum]|nr:hypothetical protein RSJ2_3702 [Clostridium botulinum]
MLEISLIQIRSKIIKSNFIKLTKRARIKFKFCPSSSFFLLIIQYINKINKNFEIIIIYKVRR